MSQRIFALDRGAKRIGLAWMDTDNKTPLPLGYIENTNTVYFELVSLIMQYRIDTIVYGYPEGNKAITDRVDRFVHSLKISVDESMIFVAVDEHYSSVEASDRTGDFNRKHISQDTVSAMVILERWLALGEFK